jgi:hypothetical protein
MTLNQKWGAIYIGAGISLIAAGILGLTVLKGK